MDIVMISTIMLVVTLMVEIAVDPMSIRNIAQHAYALKGEKEEVEELQHPQLLLQLVEHVIRAG